MNDNGPNPENSLPEEVKNFQDGEFPRPAMVYELMQGNLEILKVEADDYKWRIKNRGRFGWAIIALVWLQNIAIFALVFCAYFSTDLCNIQVILSTLVGGVLVETYFTLNYVIKWLFNNVDYKLHKLE